MSGFNPRRGRGTQSTYFDPEDRCGDQLNALARSLPRLGQHKRDLACRLLNEAEKHRLTAEQLFLATQLVPGARKRRRVRSKKNKWQAIKDAEKAAYRARLAAPWPIYICKKKGGADT